MPAILLREGFSSGLEPTLSILECVPGRTTRSPGKVTRALHFDDADSNGESAMKLIYCLTCRFFVVSSRRVWETTSASSRAASDSQRSSV